MVVQIKSKSSIWEVITSEQDFEAEIVEVCRRLSTILALINKVGARVLLCDLIPDPFLAVDSKFRQMGDLLANAILDLGPRGRFLELGQSLTYLT